MKEVERWINRSAAHLKNVDDQRENVAEKEDEDHAQEHHRQALSSIINYQLLVNYQILLERRRGPRIGASLQGLDVNYRYFFG